VNNFNPNPPDALMLLSDGCAHCPIVLHALGELLKQGTIGRLEAVNIQAHPEIAEKHRVRSVPWVRLGEFELEGLHSQAELEQWASRAGSETGLAYYYADLLKRGQLHRVLTTVHDGPQRLSALLLLAADPDTELTVRIGVSAVLEDFQASEALLQQLPVLTKLAEHEDPRVRADACHFLALTRSPEALAVLQRLAGDDPERAVRDVAADALQELQQQRNG
jgi:thioredoxin-like negative regulator of GroEL